jgi:hypothetical protein
MSRQVRRVAVDARLQGELAGAQYASAFELRTTVERTPEQWARALFEGAPVLWRWLLTLGWRFGLGLRLAPAGTSGHVQGWPIVASSPEAITLATASRLISARDVFVVADGTVTWVTIVRFEHRLGHLLWAAAAPIHHLSVPVLLPRACG